MDLNTAIVATPVIGCVLTVLLVLVADMISRKVAVIVAAAGLAICGVVAVYAVYQVEEIQSIEGVMVGGRGYSATSALVCLLSALVIVGGWHWYVESDKGGAAAALVVMVAAGSAALSGTTDLVFLLLVLEILAVSGYALVAQHGTPRSREAGVKYVIQGAVATGLLVLSLAILLGLNGSLTNVLLLAEVLSRDFAVQTMLAVGLLAAVYSYKLGAFPFHSWAPDAFETAPPASGAALASVPKVAAIISAFIIFFRGFGLTFTTVSSDGYMAIAPIWAAIATASIVFGNFTALKQTSYTRMLGYSGIAQVGYAIVGLSIVVGEAGGEASGSNMGFVFPSTAVLVSAYAIAVVGAFLVAEAVRRKRPDWDGSVNGLAGVGRTSVALGVSTAVIMLSLTGIPLTAGFWGKLGVFGAAAQAGWVWIALVGVLGSVVSFGYYGNVLKVMYLDDPPNDVSAPEPGGRLATLVVALIALIVLAIGVAPLLTGLAPIFRFFAF
jgi:NADH-quinone oxidoreductase subunit N